MPMDSNSVGTPRQDLVGAYNEFDPARQGFIADLILPRFGVEEMDGRFGRIPLEAYTTDYGEDVVRKPNAERSASSWEYEEDTWYLREYSHEEPVDRTQRRRLEKWFRSQEIAVQRCRQVIELRKERALAAVMEDTTAYPLSGSTGLSITNEWDDSANATPIDDIEQGVEALELKIGPAPLTLRITRKQHKALSNCDQILEKLKYTQRPETVLPAAELADALGIAEIIVANSVVNTASPGLSKSLSRIWSNEYASLFVKGSGETLDVGPQFGRTLELEDLAGVRVYSYEYPKRNQDVFYVEEHLQQKILDSEAHFLFGNCITI